NNNKIILEDKKRKQQKQKQLLLLSTPPTSSSLNNEEHQKPYWPLTPLRSFNSTTNNNKIYSPIKQNNNNYLIPSFNFNFPSISSQNNLLNNGYNLNNIYYPINNNNKQQQIPELVYDERLKEWIYPLGECMRNELERLAYFCWPNEKDYVFNQLCLMPSGHFMLRFSGSRRRCLALTMRVPENINNNNTINRTKGISNYLIIKNIHGFRIRGFKRYFQSLPMLITHHSVLPEQLPCRLQLSDWRWIREPKTTTNNLLRRQSSGGSTAIAMRFRDEEERENTTTIDNNSSNLFVRWRKPLLTNCDKESKQKSSIRTDSINTMLSSKSSTLLSA
ncbi:SH2 domain-containing protein, partial [Meloidogyne graminicola]